MSVFLKSYFYKRLLRLKTGQTRKKYDKKETYNSLNINVLCIQNHKGPQSSRLGNTEIQDGRQDGRQK